MRRRLRRVLSLRMPNPTGKNGHNSTLTARPLLRDTVREHRSPLTGHTCENTAVTQIISRLGRRWRVRVVEYCGVCGWREERRLP